MTGQRDKMATLFILCLDNLCHCVYWLLFPLCVGYGGGRDGGRDGGGYRGGYRGGYGESRPAYNSYNN